jgi:hypothetical protein
MVNQMNSQVKQTSKPFFSIKCKNKISNSNRIIDTDFSGSRYMNVTNCRATGDFAVESIFKCKVCTSKTYECGSGIHIQELKEKYDINYIWEFGTCCRRQQAK